MEINVHDFEIGDLAEEIAHQASLFQFYGETLANEEEKLSRLELQLEQASAETEIKYRSDAEASGKKITEGLVKAALAKDEELGELKANIITQEKAVATLKNAVRALDQKGEQLSNLVRLEVGKLYNDQSTIEATANQVRNKINLKRNS